MNLPAAYSEPKNAARNPAGRSRAGPVGTPGPGVYAVIAGGATAPFGQDVFALAKGAGRPAYYGQPDKEPGAVTCNLIPSAAPEAGPRGRLASAGPLQHDQAGDLPSLRQPKCTTRMCNGHSRRFQRWQRLKMDFFPCAITKT